MWPARASLLASWWLLREIEAAHAIREHIEIDQANKRVNWRLPPSKTDWKALGASRSHSCSCECAPAAPVSAHRQQNLAARSSLQVLGARLQRQDGQTRSNTYVPHLAYPHRIQTVRGALLAIRREHQELCT